MIDLIIAMVPFLFITGCDIFLLTAFRPRIPPVMMAVTLLLFNLGIIEIFLRLNKIIHNQYLILEHLQQ